VFSTRAARRAFAERDAVVIDDVPQPGERVADTLKEALEGQLRQSTFLTVLPSSASRHAPAMPPSRRQADADVARDFSWPAHRETKR